MLKLIKSRQILFKQLLFYGIIGGIAALVDFTIFYLFNEIFEANKFFANIISMHFGMLVSFSLNAYLNFKKTDKILTRFFTYYTVILFGILMSTFILWFLSFFITSTLIIKAISIAFVSFVQFILNKKITFKF